MSRPMYRHPGPVAARLTVDVTQEPDPVDEVAAARWISQMRADLAESLGGVMLRSARAVTLSKVPTMLSSSPGRLLGWSLHETGGSSPFLVQFCNGTETGQPIIAHANGVAGGVANAWFGPGGISFTQGLWVDLFFSTSLEGAVYLGAAD